MNGIMTAWLVIVNSSNMTAVITPMPTMKQCELVRQAYIELNVKRNGAARLLNINDDVVRKITTAGSTCVEMK